MRNATHICELRNIINLVAVMTKPGPVDQYVSIQEPNATMVRHMTVQLNWLLSELVQSNLLQTIPALTQKVTGLESTVQQLQQSITDLHGRIPSSDKEANSKRRRTSCTVSCEQDLLYRLRSLNHDM